MKQRIKSEQTTRINSMTIINIQAKQNESNTQSAQQSKNVFNIASKNLIGRKRASSPTNIKAHPIQIDNNNKKHNDNDDNYNNNAKCKSCRHWHQQFQIRNRQTHFQSQSIEQIKKQSRSMVKKSEYMTSFTKDLGHSSCG